MNKRPVYYLQTDKRWKDKPYRVPGETSTVGGSGCGPSCAAMVIETLTGKTYTPEDACKWSVDHGYKALRQGTSFNYFVPQFSAFGINCGMLNWYNSYNNPDHANHKKVRQMLEEGYYIIACMGPGLWTSGGHFILLWAWDSKVRINDSASTKEERLNGDPDTFMRQVKYYWWVDARQYNKGEDEMTEKEIRAVVRDELAKIEAERAAQPEAKWSKDGGFLSGAVKLGITDGTRPMSYATRMEAAIMAAHAAEIAAGKK